MKRVTVGSVADLAGCDPKTVRSFADRGLIRVHRDPNGWRIFRDAEATAEKIRLLMLGKDSASNTGRQEEPIDRKGDDSID